MELNSPDKISRKAKVFKLSSHIEPNSLGFLDRGATLSLFNRIGPKSGLKDINTSYYRFEERFSKQDIIRLNGRLEGKFILPENIPCTYKGKLIESKWFAEVKIDVMLWPDKRLKKEIFVNRD